MYNVHDVFAPTIPHERISGPVRVLDTISFKTVVLIEVDEDKCETPFRIPYAEWTDLISSRSVEPIDDPYLTLTSLPRSMPPGATSRLAKVLIVVEHLSSQPDVLHSTRRLSTKIAEIAKDLDISERTVKRWALNWLKAGRNPAAAVEKFVRKKPVILGEVQSELPARIGTTSLQRLGAKRGARGRLHEAVFLAPAHEVFEKIQSAYNQYIRRGRMTWREAYNQLLINEYRVPPSNVQATPVGALLDPVILEKLRPPSWPQFRYRCRQLKKADIERSGNGDLPRGKRGSAQSNVFGPGFFEIDATCMQVQLVSCLTKYDLVSRPTVYLIVDIFSGAITGYAISLENASWALAALALNNAFSDKGPVFERLGLPYKSSDWPCHQLPTVLRADRAELISNMGQSFPSSGIRVEVTPSMTPEAKGSVEGKHSELKRDRPGRFDLPGRYEKLRRRRRPDGKKDAALNIVEFERILVEMILDINGEPVSPDRIPLDAINEGSKVASRLGLYEWGVRSRPGFTRIKPPNFAFEHLLTKGTATLTSLGLKFKGAMFRCDQLQRGGYLQAASHKGIKMEIVFNPIFAGEIYFYDEPSQSWIKADNTDQEVHRSKASFAEWEQWRKVRSAMRDQASLDNHVKRAARLENVNKIIESAKKEVQDLTTVAKRSRGNIKTNKSREKLLHRSGDMHGANSTEPGASVENCSPTAIDHPENKPTQSDISSQPPIDSVAQSQKDSTKSVEGLLSLWERFGGRTKQ